MSRPITSRLRAALPILLTLSLAACASDPTRSGFLKSYEGMKPRSMIRAKAIQRKGGPNLARIHSVAILPTTLHPSVKADWLTDDAKAALLNEIDAQLCFEFTKHYVLAPPRKADARVHAAVTDLEATGRAGSVASAAVDVVIPGPIGVRPPGSTGGLSVEAEMIGRNGRQLAAISWSRDAMNVGSDNPALTRIGDAMQFAEPFADAAAKAMTAPKAEKREIGEPDPCARYGPRFRPEGFLTKLVTGLYIPEMSAAKDPAPADAKTPAPAEKK
jgi:hypothetical protein